MIERTGASSDSPTNISIIYYLKRIFKGTCLLFFPFLFEVQSERCLIYFRWFFAPLGGTFVNHHKSTQKDFFKYGAFGTRILICGGKSKCLRSDAPTTIVVLISVHRNENPLFVKPHSVVIFGQKDIILKFLPFL